MQIHCATGRAIEQSGGTVEEQDLVVSLKDEELLKNRGFNT